MAIQGFLSVIAGLGIGVSAAILPITGVQTGVDPVTGAFPARLRLQDLQNSGPQWDLYIQGLISFQNVSEHDELSYFGLSGIHGRPYVPWNGVEAIEGAPLTGYCTHNEAIFAIWHRPYVAAYEPQQVLAGHVQAAARRYTGEKAKIYRRAADSWRQPYWDWAVDRVLPDALVQTNLSIQGPDGPLTVANPLALYTFQQFPLDPKLFPPNEDFNLDTRRYTLRCPDPSTNLTNNGMASANVNDLDLASQVYDVYARVFTFEGMSTTASDTRSFEQEHNEIHVAVGCMHPPGHLADFGYSAFDPVFMTHHAAIDRHVALWQAIHYNASMFTAPYKTETGQFATAAGTTITPDSPLKPFYATANGTFHTSNSARDVASFGYSYPELLQAQTEAAAQVSRPVNGSTGNNSVGAGLGTAAAAAGRLILGGNSGNSSNSSSTRAAVGRSLRAQINALYGPGSAAALASSSSRRDELPQLSQTQFFVRVGVEKRGLPLPAVLRVWLGSVLAGRLVLTTNPRQGRVHGEISLQTALRNAALPAGPDGMAMEHIQRNLHWDVVQASGLPVQLSYAQNLSMHVRQESVQLSSDASAFPVYRLDKTWNAVESSL